jgi:hypothetical protein
MSELSVIDRGNHCEIHQGDAIAADYVASKRLATLFAAAPELLAALRELVHYDEGSSEQGSYGYEVLSRCKAAIAKAEGRE